MEKSRLSFAKQWLKYKIVWWIFKADQLIAELIILPKSIFCLVAAERQGMLKVRWWCIRRDLLHPLTGMVPLYRVSIRKHLIAFQWAGAARLNKAPLQPFVRSSPAQVADLCFTAMPPPLCPSFALVQHWNTKESRWKVIDMKSGNRVDRLRIKFWGRNYKWPGADFPLNEGCFWCVPSPIAKRMESNWLKLTVHCLDSIESNLILHTQILHQT